MNEPTVSIITPTYNRAALLAEALESVLRQTFSDFEVLILDDDSTDDTEQVVRCFADSRLIYSRLARVGRISTLRNLGLRRARGRYIAFIDSDDLWEETKLEQQVTVLNAHDSLGFVYSDVTLFNEQGIVRPRIYEKLTEREPGTNFREEIMRFEIFVRPSTILMRSTCLTATGLLDENFFCGANEFIARLACHFPSQLCPAPLVRARMHATSISATRPQDGFLEVIGATRSFLETGALPRRLCARTLMSAHWRLGRLHAQRRAFRAATAEYLRALRNLVEMYRHENQPPSSLRG